MNLLKTKRQIGVGTYETTKLEKKYIMQVLKSNRLSYGPFCKRFEREFAVYHHSKYAVFVNSGTSALSLAVACLKEQGKWRDGAEIIVPALTFVATANVVLEHNLKPVFVDCDPISYNINPKLIEEKITKKTKAIMAVHLFGQVADMNPILRIARKYHLKVIEDSCETMGVNYKGKRAGSFGDISCFSTYVAHLIVTGVGGLAVTSNSEYAEILRSLANHGRDNIYVSIDDDKDIDGSSFRETVRRRFRFVRRGYSFRATEMEAALGIAQLKRLPKILKARQKNAVLLTAKLKKYEKWLQLPSFNESTQEHAFMMYPVVIKKEAPFSKEDLVFYLEDRGVETRDMLPLINQPVYKKFKLKPKDYPVADWVNNFGFYIGCHQGMAKKDVKYAARQFEKFFQSYS